ncbi:GDSL-type esterase/lipase family protein [Streptomyces sp. NPDC088124]|uniref:SGNH/GDSL hydrolase family protein n=1 Tax=Streptomyces sp. NPDC088124 TaxID=3154654 RepID=UPI00343F8235
MSTARRPATRRSAGRVGSQSVPVEELGHGPFEKPAPVENMPLAARFSVTTHVEGENGMPERDHKLGGRVAGGIGRRALFKATSITAGGIVLGASNPAFAAGRPSEGALPTATPDMQANYHADDSVSCARGLISTNDKNIKYRGRWEEQTSGSVYGYYESGLEFGFTGTSISVMLEETCRLLHSVDGGEFRRNVGANGTLAIASGLEGGVHSVRIYSEYQQSFPKIKHFQIDRDANTKPLPERPTMEFVGDSISVGYVGAGLVNSLENSFTFRTPELLDLSHNTVAFGGIAVAAGSGGPDATGMVSRYTKLSEYIPGESGVPVWDTSQYVPDYLVINLGTNDPSTGTKAPNFKPAYTTFLENARTYYPDTVIFAMTPFNGAHRNEIFETVSARNSIGDAKVIHIETSGWIDVATETTDGTHPTVAAQDKISHKLAASLQGYFDMRMPSRPVWPAI